MHLGIIGAPGAGKDAIADFLIAQKGYKRLAFADKIKEEYYKFSGFSEAQFKDVRGEAVEEHIREGLWAYSKDAKLKYGKNYFIDPIVDNIKISMEPIVITDVRTLDEIKALRGLNLGVRFQLFLIVRNHKKELSSKNLLGTQLPLWEIMGHVPVFWNDIDGLDHAHLEFEKFYTKLKRGFVLN